MATRKRCRRDSATTILLSDIKLTSTCISIGIKARTLCYDNCQTQLDSDIGMSKKSSVPTKSFRDYEVSGRNRCQQPWAFTNCQSTCHNATVCKFIRVRKYLNINTEVEIGGKDSNVELHDSYCYTKKVKNTPSLNYQVDIHK